MRFLIDVFHCLWLLLYVSIICLIFKTLPLYCGFGFCFCSYWYFDFGFCFSFYCYCNFGFVGGFYFFYDFYANVEVSVVFDLVKEALLLPYPFILLSFTKTRSILGGWSTAKRKGSEVMKRVQLFLKGIWCQPFYFYGGGVCFWWYTTLASWICWKKRNATAFLTEK